eukprot:c10355_g1_i2.p1 GENE.c10355_g1_i2~~c10355_g1_i2.p1  ORF type:complete len:278 (+),score=113.11 c10355_g1_i2:22-855(+)
MRVHIIGLILLGLCISCVCKKVPESKRTRTNCFQVSDDKLDKIASTKYLLVFFYDSSTEYWEELRETYETVCQTYKEENEVVIAVADLYENTVIASKYGVLSTPLFFFFDKSTEPTTFVGEKTPRSFVEYINARSNAERVVGGGLLPGAGRHIMLDTLVKIFYKSPTPNQVIAGSQAHTHRTPLGSYYIEVMKAVHEKGQSYVTQEIENLLEKLESDDNKAKNTIRRRKINILRVFEEEYKNKDIPLEIPEEDDKGRVIKNVRSNSADNDHKKRDEL